MNAQISVRDDGAWYLELSKVMYATYGGIGDFEQDFEAVVEPLGESSKVGASSRRYEGNSHNTMNSDNTQRRLTLGVGRFHLGWGKRQAKKSHLSRWPKGKRVASKRAVPLAA